MKTGRLVSRGLRFYWRTHLAVFAGVVLCAAILSGALLVGDSVRDSLRGLALLRLGRTGHVISAGERFFRAALADELGADAGVASAAVLYAPGVPAEGAGQVDVYGVTAEFFALCREGAPPVAPPGPGEVLLGERLAARLGLGPGDDLQLRFERPSALTREVGLVPATGRTAALRLTVRELVPDAALGRFSLRAEQLPPLNAFVAREELAAALEREGRANLLLLAEGARTAALEEALEARWRPEDVDLSVRRVAERPWLELRSDRVFLDSAVAAVGPRLAPGCEGVLGYLVNALAAGERAVPYAFVVGLDGALPLAPGDGLVASDWLAGQLGVAPGDSVALSYYAVGPERRLEERSLRMEVTGTCPVTVGDPALAPELPGLTGKDTCSDWDPGLPVDLGKIREEDEKFWEDHGATPKAYVSLARAQELWRNDWGAHTALRFPLRGSADSLEAQLRAGLRRELAARDFGFEVRDVRAAALTAADPTTDFGQLFGGLSFFLILSALFLVGLLFAFGVEQRLAELGTLGALGFPARRLRRLLTVEGAALALLGSLLGALLGAGYALLVLGGLRGVWRGAVGTDALALSVRPLSLAIGAVAAALVALGTMRWVLRKALRLSPQELLRRRATLPLTAASGGRRKLFAGLAAAGALVMAGLGASGSGGAGLFFGAGALLLTALLCWPDAAPGQRTRLRLPDLRASPRAGGRRTVTRVTLAIGVFLVFAVGANRRAVPDPREKQSGTGGFALLVETTRPVLHDLNEAAGREVELAVDADFAGVQVVPLRVGGGEDASCLNLNRVARPRLLGVAPEELRGRFRFASSQTATDDPWSLLARPLPADSVDVVPVIADENTVLWSLGLGLGSRIAYTDERGRPFEVEIVAMLSGSMLQGSLLLADAAFRARFPSTEGARQLLVEVPPARVEDFAAALRRGLRDHGAEVTPAPERLAALFAVENTYLAIFLTLGGLALLLGTVGVGIVVVRTVLESRAELALLAALGFTRARLERLLLGEHGRVVASALLYGLLAAALAAFPALQAGTLPLLGLALWALGIALSSFLWVLVAVRLASRGRLLAALRAE